jgi:Rrf2 family transcriptional regulator, cysteine metabolism repressor
VELQATMRISAKAEYACLAMIALARPGSDGLPMRIREIADGQGIPERYLVQILLQLKASGLVHSVRGAIGGYQLAQSPESITVADVLAAIDGPGDPPRKPTSLASRSLSDLLDRAQAAHRSVLAAVSLSTLAEPGVANDYVL